MVFATLVLLLAARLSGACDSPPCPAALLNDVGLTTVSGTDARSGVTLQVGENIFGPFEAGFGSSQDFILERLGCSRGSDGHVAGGIDTYTAEQMVAQQCSVSLPRTEGNNYISLLDECGGHTKEYHFHERLSCLYSSEPASGHSTQVGRGNDGRLLYGKWEDFDKSVLPLLDACGGHFGVTPDSAGEIVYHYHVQEFPPFTFGCYGPIETSSSVYKMVTVSECRALYDECGNGDVVTLTLPLGNQQYDPWCPCYDAEHSNVGTQQLAVFASGSGQNTTCSGAACATHGVTSRASGRGSQTALVLAAGVTAWLAVMS